MKSLALTLLLALAGCGEATTQESGPPPQALPTTQLSLAGKPFTLEVADEPKEREIGMMYRRSIPDGTGMLFVFPDVEPRSFWMRNTYVPLDIVYLDPAGRVVSIKPAKPLDLSGVPSDGEAQFVIELSQGTSKAIGLKPGDVVELSDELKSAGK